MGFDQHSLDLADSDTLEAFYLAQTNTETRFLQMSRGAAVLNARSSDFGDLKILQVSGDGRHLFHDRMLADEWRFALLCKAEGDPRIGQTDLSPTTAHLLKPGEEAELRTNGVYTTLEISFSDVIPDQCGWRCPYGGAAQIDIDLVTQLRSAAHQAFSKTERGRSDTHWRAMFLDLLECALRPWQARETLAPTKSANHDLVAKARALLWEVGSDTTPDTESLAAQIGVSKRRIYQAFKSELGIGPRRFQELVRLNALRKSLTVETPDTSSVTFLANSHGFSELGRVAGSYRSLFGELPSETLKRRQRRMI